MNGSGAILGHISSLKDMLDQVNEEIELNIQITREIESEIVRCSEIEIDLSIREAELMKQLYISNFELNGLLTVTVDSRNSVKLLEEEAHSLKSKQEGILKRMNNKRLLSYLSQGTGNNGKPKLQVPVSPDVQLWKSGLYDGSKGNVVTGQMAFTQSHPIQQSSFGRLN